MRFLAAMAALSLLAGCGNASVLAVGGASDDPETNTDVVEHTGACAKIEGAQIGVENLTIEVGTKTLTFHNWVLKNGEAGEYIGFSYAQSGSLSVRVKAGGEVYDAAGGDWENPNAEEDPSASAVSNVEGCDPDGDDPGDGDSPDGGDPDDSDSPDDGDDLPDNN